MSVVGIPDVVVLEAVQVHLEPAIVVDVHVGNEELYGAPSAPLPFEIYEQLNFIWDVAPISKYIRVALQEIFLFR